MNKCRHEVEASSCEICQRGAKNEASMHHIQRGREQAKDEIAEDRETNENSQ